MKHKEVKVGSVYTMKVSGILAAVKVVEDLGTYTSNGRVQFRRQVTKHKGWRGVNMRTGREVHIRTAAKLRSECVTSQKPNQTSFGLDGSVKVMLPMNHHWVITLHVKDIETKASLQYTTEELETEVRRVIGRELLLGIDSLEIKEVVK